ncbi:MAG TPA: hypothetical protein VFR94_19095 [Nitrososphaeraceae archaeon]|nr:hypothetical protein [Nitrososphaeraceae archaeon]
MSKASNKDNEKQNIQQDATKDSAQRLERWGTLDVLGQPAEPICTYYRCHISFHFMVRDVADVSIQQTRRWGYK